MQPIRSRGNFGQKEFGIDDMGGQTQRGNAMKFTVERVALERMIEQLKIERGTVLRFNPNTTVKLHHRFENSVPCVAQD
jgi:hypothetical protein